MKKYDNRNIEEGKQVKKMQKFIATFVALCMGLTTVSFAAEPISQMIQDDSIGNRLKSYGFTIEKTEEMISALTASENKMWTIDTDGVSADYYKGEIIEDYLYSCEEVTNVEALNGLLYICYESMSNEMVVLTYSGNSLIAKMVYDRDCDTLYNYDYLTGKSTAWEDFIGGSSYAITEEQLDNITTALEANDLDMIEAMPNLEIIESEGVLLIVPYDIPQVFDSDVKTNCVLPDPVTIQQYNGLQHSSYLDTDIPTQVYEKRNTYTEISSEVQHFGVGTAVTIISTFLTGGTGTVAIRFTTLVLSAMSLAIDQAGKIKEAARIYRSAEHQFRTELVGLVSDNTRYNGAMVEALYGADTSGRMSGGHSPDDYDQAEWNWVTTQYSSYSNRNESYYENYAANAMMNYERDLISHFGITSLPPALP